MRRSSASTERIGCLWHLIYTNMASAVTTRRGRTCLAISPWGTRSATSRSKGGRRSQSGCSTWMTSGGWWWDKRSISISGSTHHNDQCDTDTFSFIWFVFGWLPRHQYNFSNFKKKCGRLPCHQFIFKNLKTKYYSHNYLKQIDACLVGCHANSLIFLYIFRFVLLYWYVLPYIE